MLLGANASHIQSLQALGTEHIVTSGLQSRADFLSPVGLYRTERRDRLSTVREDDVTEAGTGVYVEAQSRWRPWLRTTLGMRGDAYTFDVTSDRPENSGRHTAAIASPKTSLVFVPTATTQCPRERHPVLLSLPSPGGGGDRCYRCPFPSRRAATVPDFLKLGRTVGPGGPALSRRR